jgi:ATP-dependent helicase/nuclease subunit B
LKFGCADDALGKYLLDIDGKRRLRLRGKIDRLDVADGGAAVVFDYKRKARSFNWERFYHGLDIQLGIYMNAVRQSRGGSVAEIGDLAGAFYFPVEADVQAGDIRDLEKQVRKTDRKAKGVFNGRYAEYLDSTGSGSEYYNFRIKKDGDPYGDYNRQGIVRPENFKDMLSYAGSKAVELAGGIVSGRIDARPYRLGTESACRRCEYGGVCRFDWNINDYNSLSKKNKQQVLTETGNEDG